MFFKNIILDWSGTLVDDFGPVLEATNGIFKRFGRAPMTEAEFREKFFLPFPEFYRKYLPGVPLKKLEAHFHRVYPCLQKRVRLLPGTLRFLKFCRKRQYRLFLLSSIHADHFKAQGRRLGLSGYFEKAYVQVLDKKNRIRQILAENRLDPAHTLFVGDMRHDIETGRHGGVTTAALLTGYDSLAKLKKSSPDLLFRDLDGLREYLARLPEKPDGHPVPAVGALIFDKQGRVLLIRSHKWSDTWTAPGGKIRTGETAEQTLRREVFEETGLRIHAIRFETLADCINPPEFFRPAHFLLLNYSCRATRTKVRLDHEGGDFRWVAPAEALRRLPLSTPTRRLLAHYLAR